MSLFSIIFFCFVASLSKSLPTSEHYIYVTISDFRENSRIRVEISSEFFFFTCFGPFQWLFRTHPYLIKTELVILAPLPLLMFFRIILNYVSDNYHNITSSLSTRYTIYIILHILICSLLTT